MLRAVKHQKQRKTNASFTIVASQYNARYVDAMVRAAKAELRGAGAAVHVIRVPGAFEIPVVAAALAEQSSLAISGSTPNTTHLSAILCFGVIFQGQTSHAQHIGWGVTHALAQIQVLHRIPIIHAVFTFEQEEHARVRCLGRNHNRGTEAARTALQMAEVMAALQPQGV